MCINSYQIVKSKFSTNYLGPMCINHVFEKTINSLLITSKTYQQNMSFVN